MNFWRRGGMKMRIVTVKMPQPLLQHLDKLVAKGVFKNRSEAIRRAVILLLTKHGVVFTDE